MLAAAARKNILIERGLKVQKHRSRSQCAPWAKRGDTTLIVVLVITGILITVLIVLLAMGVFSMKRIAKLPARPVETSESKFTRAAAAFNGPPLDASDPSVSSIHRSIDALRKSIKDGDVDSFVERIDYERLFQEIMRTTRDYVYDPLEQKGFVIGLKRGMTDEFSEYSELASGTHYELSDCRFSDGGNEATFFIRMRDGDGGERHRWWMAKQGDRWLLYDYEELDCAIRLSDSMAIYLNATENSLFSGDMKASIDLRSKAVDAIQQGKFEEADQYLSQINTEGLPPLHLGLFHLTKGTGMLNRGRYAEAIAEYNVAEDRYPEMARLCYLRGFAQNELKQFGAARFELERYLDLLGRDAEAFQQLGIALEGLGLKEEALAAYRRGLDDNPDSLLNLYRLALLLPDDKKTEVGERFAKMQRTEEQFDTLYEWLRWIDPGALQEIAKQYAMVAPGNAKLALLQVGELLKKEDYEGAAQTSKAAIATAADADVKRQLVWRFCSAMQQLNREMAAYEDLSRSDEAFRTLAGGLVGEEHFDRLKSLIEVRRADAPEDPWVHFYSGVAAIHDKHASEGIAQLRNALNLATDDDTKRTIRYRLVSEMFNAGRALEALQQLEPKLVVFEQLAMAAKYGEQPETLSTLIEEFRMIEPMSPAITRTEMELAYLKQDYATALEIARRPRTPVGDAEEDDSYQYDDYVIRSLIWLKRYDEAEQEMERLKQKNNYDSAWYPTLVAAARGDVARTRANLEKLVAEDWEPSEFYGDDILGPALRSDAFKELREKYPEPEVEEPLREGTD